MKRYLSILLGIALTLGLVTVSSFATDETPLIAEYEDYAAQETTWAAHEVVFFKDAGAMKLTPNVVESAGKQMQIRGWSYTKLKVDLEKYNWVVVRYYYDSENPISTKLGVTIKNKNNINLDKTLWEDKGLHMKQMTSEENIVAGKWAYAVVNVANQVQPAFDKNADIHHLGHMDIMPFGGNALGTVVKETDVFYIDKVMFYVNKPIITKGDDGDTISAGTELGFEPVNTEAPSQTTPEDTTPTVKVEEGELGKVFAADKSIVIDFADYQNGPVNGQDTATVEVVTEDGKRAVKIVPNNQAKDATQMKIEGYQYAKAKIDVGKYKWLAMEYKYVSPAPMNTTLAVHLKNNGDILDPASTLKATVDSSWKISEGAWTVALFRIESMHQYLREGNSEHILRQMHVLPFNVTNVRKSSGSDVIYIGRLAFLEEKPDIANAVGIKSTIEFDSGHPSAVGKMEGKTIDFESKIALPEPTYTLEGFEFSGWKYTGDGGLYNAGDEVTIYNESALFTATWKRVASYADSVSLSFPDYSGGIVISHKTATLEKVIEDGRSALKIVPIPDCPESNVIKIEGTAYGGIGLNLDVYKWAAVEYKYVSKNPGAYNVAFNIKTGAGNILKEEYKLKANPQSREVMTAGSWNYAVLDLSMVDEMLNPNVVEHDIRQMHVLPFGNANLRSISADDTLYISNIMFFKQEPKFETFASYITGYSDGSFKPSNTMTRAEACTVIARILEKENAISGTSTFSDVPAEAWYSKYIGFLQNKGLLNSYSGAFTPDKAITRAEFAELVYLTRLAEDKGNAVSFTDVKADHPKYASIMAAASAGLVGGYLEADNTYTFRPDNTITRAEVVTVINRARGTTRKADFIGEDIILAFIDVDRTHWAFGDIVVASVPHAEVDGKWLHASKDVMADISSKVDLASFYDLSAGNAKVAELDELEAKRIAEIRNTPSMTVDATVKYYVSASGNDANDGKSEGAPFKTIAKAVSAAKSGDAILIKRGDMFRERFVVPEGVTVTAYGEGAKPLISGSPENGADASKWVLDFENAETGAKIWRYSNTGMTDVGNIIINDGEKYAWKDNPAKKEQSGTVYVMATDKTKEYDYKISLDTDLKFFHNSSSIGDITYAVGPLYLRCDAGNPGEIFNSIEFAPRGNTISVGGNNVTVDNLCIKYAGSHGIGAGTVKNLIVTNCEIGWIGGSAQTFRNAGSMTRFGNGVEIYGGTDNYRVENCYIYQCYDAGVTHQYDNNSSDVDIEMYNVLYKNNVITECVYSIEYFLADSATRKRVGKGIVFEGNLCRRAGYGFGSTRPNGHSQRHIRCTTSANPFSDFTVRNNIFDRSVYELFQTTSNYNSGVPVYEGNTYIVGIGNQLFTVGIGRGRTYYVDISAKTALKNAIGDTSGTIYFVENIPYYTFPHTSK